MAGGGVRERNPYCKKTTIKTEEKARIGFFEKNSTYSRGIPVRGGRTRSLNKTNKKQEKSKRRKGIIYIDPQRYIG